MESDVSMSGNEKPSARSVGKSAGSDTQSETVETKGAKKADREEAIQRKEHEQAVRLEPLLERLHTAPFGKFEDELKAALRSLEAAKDRRSDTAFLLKNAFLWIPEGTSGAVVAKHYKSAKKWITRELNEAIRGLASAASRPEAQRALFGQVMHGALITFVSGANDLEKDRVATTPESKKGVVINFDETVKLLVELHRAIPQSTHVKFVGLDDPPVEKILSEARALFMRHLAVDGVHKMRGQRLFGFDFLFVLDVPASVENPVAAAQASDVSIEFSASKTSQEEVPERRAVTAGIDSVPTANSEQTSRPSIREVVDDSAEETAQIPASKPVAKPVEQPREPRPVQVSNDLHAERPREFRAKSEASEGALDSSAKAPARLKTSLGAAERELSSLRHQVREVHALREDLLHAEQQLQATADELARVKNGLSEERSRVVELDRTRQELVEQNRRLESAVSLAKETEFDRGRAAMRATIAKHCLQSLGQIADEAGGIAGISGKFIKDMAGSLSRYLQVED